jgi:hypothetical protein
MQREDVSAWIIGIVVLVALILLLLLARGPVGEGRNAEARLAPVHATATA